MSKAVGEEICSYPLFFTNSHYDTLLVQKTYISTCFHNQKKSEEDFRFYKMGIAFLLYAIWLKGQMKGFVGTLYFRVAGETSVAVASEIGKVRSKFSFSCGLA